MHAHEKSCTAVDAVLGRHAAANTRARRVCVYSAPQTQQPLCFVVHSGLDHRLADRRGVRAPTTSLHRFDVLCHLSVHARRRADAPAGAPRRVPQSRTGPSRRRSTCTRPRRPVAAGQGPGPAPAPRGPAFRAVGLCHVSVGVRRKCTAEKLWYCKVRC